MTPGSLLVLLTVFFASNFSVAHAENLEANISLSKQSMVVKLDKEQLYNWAVSTGKVGYRTPTGTFKPQRLNTIWYSTKYDNAPMPYSIFFYGGYAIHGTTELSRLGEAASHGCVRLHPDNAKILFDLVRQVGRTNTTIRIVQ